MNLNKLIKKITNNQLLMVVAAVALVYGFYHYSSQKSMVTDNMANTAPAQAAPVGVKPANPLGGNGGVGSADGLSTSQNGLPANASKKRVVDPKELLPKGGNTEFSKLNPNNGDLSNVSLLKAGHHVGINTVGTSLRNANLQLRSEPQNPRMAVGPWNQSTISGDTMRRSLEIGN